MDRTVFVVGIIKKAAPHLGRLLPHVFVTCDSRRLPTADLQYRNSRSGDIASGKWEPTAMEQSRK